jgi:hypothetical protein|tara:strand:- start:14 stop:664 length:651 start_codon:yes stop_codon:yes gene_type:complete
MYFYISASTSISASTIFILQVPASVPTYIPPKDADAEDEEDEEIEVPSHTDEDEEGEGEGEIGSRNSKLVSLQSVLDMVYNNANGQVLPSDIFLVEKSVRMMLLHTHQWLNREADDDDEGGEEKEEEDVAVAADEEHHTEINPEDDVLLPLFYWKNMNMQTDIESRGPSKPGMSSLKSKSKSRLKGLFLYTNGILVLHKIALIFFYHTLEYHQHHT